VLRVLAVIALSALACAARSEGLSAERLGVLYNVDDASSSQIARFYAARRGVPAGNVMGLHLGNADVIAPQSFAAVRRQLLESVPGAVQSFALLWSRPYAVGCMSITTAVAAGYRPEFCEPGCKSTAPNPLFDSQGWLPADTVGWWPSMLIPTDDAPLARALIERGMAADATAPAGTVYLVRTQDGARNVRSASYAEVESTFGGRVHVVGLSAPVTAQVNGAIAYFTGVARVAELAQVHFLPGAVADHLTSTGGVLTGGNQMSVLAWLNQGATASYGTVSEPCSHLGKFPNIEVLLRHYLRGETVLEAYWKSVAMPGQGLIVGEPLSRPYAPAHR
jgi:uncharacterized protein (TIGR03790 family)